MSAAWCVLISYGVESGSKTILKNINKNIDYDQIIKTFEITKKCGIKTRVSLMVGNPGENELSIKETIELLSIIRPHAWSVNIAKIYPKTDMYEKLLNDGLISDDYWINYKDTPYYTFEHNKEILVNYKKMLEQFLIYNRFFNEDYVIWVQI